MHRINPSCTWFFRRGNCRFIITIAAFAYMVYVTTLLRRWQQFSSIIDDSRRLTEAQSQVQVRPQAPLRPWLDPPSPLLTGHVWNTTNTQWIGNSFYFRNSDSSDKSNSFQLYTPHQIQKAFRYHSILLQGDSTVRRLYGSLHGILSYDVWTGFTSADFPKGFPSQVPNPPFGIPASYFVRRGLDARSKGVDPAKLLSLLIHSPSPIDPRLLEHRTIVDVNKDFYTEPCNRKFPSSYIMRTPSFGKQPSEDIDNMDESSKGASVSTAFKSSQFEYKVCRTHPTGGWLPPVSISQSQLHPKNSPLLYDHMNTNCLGHIHDFVTRELSYQSITRQYSLYVVGPGVWETVKQAHCHHPFYERLQSSSDWWESKQVQWPDTVYRLLQETLYKLAMLAEKSPELLIIWRTSGYYDGDKQSHVVKEMNRQAVEFIRNWNDKHTRLRKENKSNFMCMDFGSAVEHRSHGKKRLRGDMQAHYGLEVRVLQVQMLANLLYEHGYVK